MESKQQLLYYVRCPQTQNGKNRKGDSERTLKRTVGPWRAYTLLIHLGNKKKTAPHPNPNPNPTPPMALAWQHSSGV
jgi:hypothetical protein